MFAYCNNNPVIYSDVFGTGPNLLDYLIIHGKVQGEVAKQTGFSVEVHVSGDLGKGRLDLYDVKSNTFYEVKSSGQAAQWPSSMQRLKYITSHITDKRFKGIHYSSPTPGTIIIKGQFYYKNYLITYEAVGTELIVYTVEQLNGDTQPSTVPVTKDEKSFDATYVFPIYGLPVPAPAGGMLPGGADPLRAVIK